MGVIRRQSIKQSIVSYAGVLIGMVSTLFIYTAVLTKAELGFVEFFKDIVQLIAGFVLLGSHQISMRFFPYFQNDANGHNGFLSFLSGLVLSGFGVFLVLNFFFFDTVVERFDEGQQAFSAYFWFIIPAVLLVAYWSLLSVYCFNFKRIVVPTIFNNLFKKLAIPTLAVFYFVGVLSFQGFMWGLLGMHLVIVVALLLYLRRLGQLHFTSFRKFMTPKLGSEIYHYGIISILGGLGSTLAYRIDKYMVSDLINFESNGVFSIAATIALVIDIPRVAINSIAVPIIAQSWKENDLVHIKALYQKTSLNQFVVGILMLVGIWASVDELFRIIPHGEEYATGKYIILILGTARLVDMLTSVNSEIIQFSTYYRYNLYATLTLAVLNIGANLVLIPHYGINGAALATLLSLTLFNVFKYLFIYIKFGMQPLQKQHFWVFIVALGTYYLHTFLPSTHNVIFDILMNSVFISIVFGAVVWVANLAPDIRQFIAQHLEQFFKKG